MRHVVRETIDVAFKTASPSFNELNQYDDTRIEDCYDIAHNGSCPKSLTSYHSFGIAFDVDGLLFPAAAHTPILHEPVLAEYKIE
jgi:hypothetical protein